MRDGSRPRIGLIIPARDEEEALPMVLGSIPVISGLETVVVDNGSTDRTAEVARGFGVKVLREERPGYGSACLKGMEYFSGREPEVVAFLDADYSDYPGELRSIVEPVLDGSCDLVIGSRMINRASRKALPLHARLGNALTVSLIRLLFGFSFTDLGPFRAVRFVRLKELAMEDRTFGWTVEMQVKAALRGLRIRDVPVSYRKRTGRSKISGTLRGSVLAGLKILGTVLRLYTRGRRS